MVQIKILYLLNMNFRFMRTLLFFDLPVETTGQRKAYRKFVKDIISLGFYRLQESVFVKLSIDMQSVLSTQTKIKDFLPKDGNVVTLSITEKQFASMSFLLGENNSDIELSDDRLLEI